MRKQIFRAIVIICIGASFAVAQKIKIDKLTVKGSVFENTILSVCQDKYGYIWFGTSAGIKVFNGTELVSYKSIPDDTTSLSDNYIHCIYSDSQGDVWVGTGNGGLNKFDYKNGTFQRIPYGKTDGYSLSNKSAWVIYEDKKGIIWIGTDGGGLNRLDRTNMKFSYYQSVAGDPQSISSNLVRAITEDEEGNLWLGTKDAGLEKLYVKRGVFTHFHSVPEGSLSNNNIRSLLLDKNGMLWIGTDKGLNLLNTKTGAVEIFYKGEAQSGKLRSDKVYSLLQDGLNNIWIGTDAGLSRYNLTNRKIFNLKYNFGDPDDANSNSLRVLYKDRSGLIWIGTSQYGVSKFDPNSLIFSYYKDFLNIKSSYRNKTIRSVLADRTGNIWIGMNEDGLFRLNRTKDKTDFILIGEKDKEHTSVYSLEEAPDGSIWAGTNGEGLYVLNKETTGNSQGGSKNIIINPNVSDSVAANVINDIYCDSSGDVWAGTDAGLFRKNAGESRFSSLQLLNSGSTDLSVHKIFKDSRGIYWIGTVKGLFALRRETGGVRIKSVPVSHKKKNSHQEIAVICITEDLSGNIWLGTQNGCIIKLKNKGIQNVHTEYTVFDSDDGVPGSIIYGILTDNNGNIWCSTNNGLSKYDIQNKKFLNYYAEDGIQSNQFFYGAYCKGKDGELFFGGYNGLSSFYPEYIKDEQVIPVLAFTNISILGKSFRRWNQLIKPEQLVIEPKTNYFSVEFSVLDYKSTEKNQYAYYLEGLDTSWNYIGSRGFVAFNNLEGGNYRLRIRGADSKGVWNLEGIAMNIKVIPPFYATWWFRIIAVLGLIIAITAVYELRLRLFVKKNEQLANLNSELKDEIDQRKKIEEDLKEAKVKAEESDRLKSEFLAQISHEIRTPINAILCFLSLIKEEASDKVDDYIKEGFNIVENGSKRLIRTVDLILNVSQVQIGVYKAKFGPVDLNNIVYQIVSELKSIADTKSIELEFSPDENLKPIFADSYSVAQIAQNLIDNAVKFTKEGKVRVEIVEDPEIVYLIVEDTGVGISEEYIPHLFKPFSQEETGYSRKFEGNGLGLTLVQKYCELNGAEIKVKSTKDKGSVFTVILKKSG